MVSVDSFLRFVLPAAPTAAQISAERYIVDSAIEVCVKTGIWRETLAVVENVAGQPDVTLSLPQDSQLIQITDLYFDGRHIEPVGPDSVQNEGDSWFEKTSSLPRGYFSTRPGVITLFPVPDVVADVRVSAKLAPSRDAQELPDVLLNQYAETVAKGAIYRLLMEPNQAYSDPRKASFVQEEFRDCLAAIQRQAQKGFSRARFRTKPFFY